ARPCGCCSSAPTGGSTSRCSAPTSRPGSGRSSWCPRARGRAPAPPASGRSSARPRPRLSTGTASSWATAPRSPPPTPRPPRGSPSSPADPRPSPDRATACGLAVVARRAPADPRRMTSRPFAQVDVFSAVPYRGNPVAVVLDGAGLTTEQMQQVANWTNLSETTFVLPPTDPAADYRVRIFTPTEELPFAGHPTIGTCHAWLATTDHPGDTVVQECGAGLVTLRRTGDRLAFAAPPLLRDEPVDEQLQARIARLLGIDRSAIRDARWVDNGPGWVAVLLDDAKTVLGITPNAEDL